MCLAAPPAAASAAPAAVRKTCLACGKQGVKNRCGGCKRVFFCDRECQRQSWTTHRPLCVPPTASEAAEGSTVRIPAETPAPAPSIPCAAAATASPMSAAPEKTSPPCHKSVRLVTEPVRVVEIPVAVAAAEEQQQRENEPVAAPTSTSKKSKKHKKKRKARSNSLHAPPKSASLPQQRRKERSVSLGARRHVMWGGVSAREFARFPGGGSAVPYDGTWALGLGRPVADVELGSVLEVEELRERELQARAKSLSKTKRRDVRVGETRQFDYRRGVDNPLFERLSEDERKHVFELEKQTQEDSAIERDIQLSTSPDAHSHLKARRKYSTSSSSSLEPVEELEAADAALTTPDFGCVSIEQLDEFAKIRDSRDAACGCSCGDLAKKVAKMNVKKLHAFLQERGVPLPGHGKAELMTLAKQVARQQKNCQSADSDCECARNGVPCHSDACEGCADDCWNPLPRYVYKSGEVKQYRKAQLARWQQLEDELKARKDATPSVCVA
ncbi:hypothetical protein BBJ28_00022745 [Nothophytophthora sp. Chile5]|nr:hypothetical protein BBJ28_00022745 [Nothophytophthora sp. Chile5]